MMNGEPPAWLRAAVYLGVPSVIALFLVWVLTQAIAIRLAHIEGQLAQQGQQLAQASRDVAALKADALASHETLEAAVRRLCVVLAHTPEERADCLTAH